jgi:sterol 22-desaturase
MDNITGASMPSSANFAPPEQPDGSLAGPYFLLSLLPDSLSGWKLFTSVLLLLVVYDQGKNSNYSHIQAPANLQSVMYIQRKGTIAGPTFKIPFMGPFVQALHPKFESYLTQWASGPLSCVSVFHKQVKNLLKRP